MTSQSSAAPHTGSGAGSGAGSGGRKGFVLVAAVYLLGLFIGALDTGIVTPARTVIQGDLGISEQLSVWIITIYTLAYAAAIPVMGKLADRSGRKYVYLASILLFGVGSLLCGLAQDVGSFGMLLVARAIQAVGGGGIVPVATAEFGTAFPPEKRGLALGLVGGVYGIANIFGASAGSLILSIFGQSNWQFIFYVNVPICAFIVVAGWFVLPNTKAEHVKPIDGLGIAVLVVMVLALLYGLKNLDFFNLGTSLTSTDVWPFLLGFVVLLPLFVLIERRAADPVLNLSYFRNRDIVVTLAISVISGVILMGIIFIPQFAENVLKIPAGSGGYVVIVLAAFAGVGAPVSGKLIDRFGVKVVLGFGLAASAAGALFLALVATQFPNLFTLVVSLVFIGIGMGFTIGTPLNYMMLAKTPLEESNSALATLSLVRSVGTAVAPAVLVAFIAHAGMAVPDRVMNVLPDPPAGPTMAQLASREGQDSGGGLPADLQQLMEGSDVTTIVGNVKKLAKTEIEQAAASSGMPTEAVDAAEQQYLSEIDQHASDIENTFQGTLDEGFRGAFLLVGTCSLVGLALLAFYREDKKSKKKPEKQPRNQA
ncbi:MULTISPECIES: MFS transporter [Gordonibacter]|uniref:MFS transporter n=1 Tax=Gordonibacter faecis TaxID=3047475 RepID=A0ABT7DJE0_9ACTN|nr:MULTISPECIES: MFS transporter [unclassified Gordonibacter]MDJ1649639.1 MFS transporter [Gordonibacter sp. KGMB12511]HIW76585.1 MFS transporter [Candidatus Gordonibacter avicola]